MEAAMQWSDVFGMIIAVLAVVITVLSIFVAYLLSRNYASHVGEIQSIRGEYGSLTRQLSDATKANSGALREALLAVQVIFDLHMLKSRREEFRITYEELDNSGEWGSRTLSETEKNEYLARIQVEVRSVETSITARETELYWLVGDDHEKSAHLHAIVETHGDDKSVLLIEKILQLVDVAISRDELIEAASRLRQRIGKPKRPRSRRVQSSTWTGIS
jgi:hypothetical protein